MRQIRTHAARLALAAAGLALSACGGGPGPKSVTVRGQDIKFDVTALTATVGQTVNVTFVNEGALEHSFVIDELGVKQEGVAPGQTVTFTFTPNGAGTFTYYCNVPGHREAGMVGTLTISP